MTPSFTFVQRVLPPERSAAGAYVVDVAQALAERGARVTLIGLPPVDPVAGKRGSVETISCGPSASRARSLAARILSLPTMHAALAVHTATATKADVLVTTSDPPFSAVWASAVAQARGIRHVCWCQDLYPETAAAAGVLKEGSLIFRLLRAAMHRALQRAHAVFVPGRCMQSRLSPVVSSVVPNWTRIPAAAFASTESPAHSRDFTVLYSGHLGRVHDFDALLGAVEIAASRHLPHRYVIAGSGPQRPRLEEAARRWPGLIVQDPVPAASLPEHLSRCDAHLITLGAGFLGCSVPSKLYDAAASGRPILFSGPPECETACAIREAGLGIVLRPGDATGLVEAAETWRANPQSGEAMGRSGREFAARSSVKNAAQAFWDTAYLPLKKST